MKFHVRTKVVSGVLAATLAVACPVVFASPNQQAVATSTTQVQPAPIHWAGSFAAAQQQARANGKLIMIDFYTDWCGWCKVLDEHTYPDSRVKVLASNLVALKLDAEKGGASLAEKYKVEAYPTIMFVDANGNVVQKVEGYQDGDDFSATMSQILQKNSSLQQKADGQPDNALLQVSMAVASASSGSVDDALRYLKKAETLDPHNQTGALSAAYQAVANNYFVHKQYAESIDYLKRQIDISPATDETIIAKLLLATSYALTDQNDSAIQTAEEVLHTPQATKEEKELAQKVEPAV
jgi:thiol:disulfide interchange protein